MGLLEIRMQDRKSIVARQQPEDQVTVIASCCCCSAYSYILYTQRTPTHHPTPMVPCLASAKTNMNP